MKRLGLRLHADEEHWIPLADLMTGLMFLFLLIALAYMVQVELQQRKPKDALAAYAQTRTQLYHDLDGAFAPDLAKWGAQLDPNTLAIRFRAGNVLFTPGSAEISPRFKTMLDDFFPRYLRVLSQPQYRDIISEVRIEGFTSSFWRSGASVDESYIGNLALSQDRARSVAAYVLAIPAVQPQKAWLMRVLAANGLSSSHLMYHADGSEDADASQRVEFGVRTNADAQVRNVLALSAPPSPNAAGSEAVTVDDSMPPFASWAAPMIGKPLAMYFPKKSSRCLGYLDGAILKYAGARTGTQVYGWSFDPASEAPLSRVLLTDAAGTIAGAGDGGFPRPDVPAKLAQIASPTTGWEGYVAAVAQPIAAWGVTGAPGTVCRLQPARAFGNGW